MPRENLPAMESKIPHKRSLSAVCREDRSEIRPKLTDSSILTGTNQGGLLLVGQLTILLKEVTILPQTDTYCREKNEQTLVLVQSTFPQYFDRRWSRARTHTALLGF